MTFWFILLFFLLVEIAVEVSKIRKLLEAQQAGRVDADAAEKH